MALSALLSERRDAIIRRWTERVRGTLHPPAMPRLELVDHLPEFLDEVADALRRRESPDTSATAADHGTQRLGLGFSLDSVVREYGALRDAVVEEAAVNDVALRPVEREVLFDCIITGIAEAISEYQRQRDTEQQRQTNEHFAFVAHELRNPLGSTLMALRLLQERGRISDERLENALERGLSRMKDVIERSLRAARIGSGITLRREKTRLRSLLDDAVAASAVDGEAKSVHVVVHLETDREVTVDTRLVHSALTNLLRNAVKFTHASSRVEVRAVGDDRTTVIEVEDCCGGLPDGFVHRAFAPFVQLGADRSGFGLGLSIAKQAIEAHGGGIRVQNLPGKGCIFTIELPDGAGT